MTQFRLLIIAVIAALALATLVVTGRDLLKGDTPSEAGRPEAHIGPPWEIEALPGGRSRVAGLVLSDGSPGAPGSTLHDAQRLWSDRIEVAIVAAPDELGALEAFIDPAMLGFITGKLVLSLRIDPALIPEMKLRAAKVDFMESTTRKFTLSAADLARVQAAPVVAMAFVPQSQLSEDTVVGRFGQPAERLAGEGQARHFLYPDKGLDVVLDEGGKEVLQYVAPARFEQLRAPLLRFSAPAGRPASAP